MTNPNSVAPNFRDRARACRLVHAMLSDDRDLVRHIIGEPQTVADITHLVLALADETAMSLKHRKQPPQSPKSRLEGRRLVGRRMGRNPSEPEG